MNQDKIQDPQQDARESSFLGDSTFQMKSDSVAPEIPSGDPSALQLAANNSPQVMQLRAMQRAANNSVQVQSGMAVQRKVTASQPIQRRLSNAPVQMKGPAARAYIEWLCENGRSDISVAKSYKSNIVDWLMDAKATETDKKEVVRLYNFELSRKIEDKHWKKKRRKKRNPNKKQQSNSKSLPTSSFSKQDVGQHTWEQHKNNNSKDQLDDAMSINLHNTFADIPEDSSAREVFHNILDEQCTGEYIVLKKGDKDFVGSQHPLIVSHAGAVKIIRAWHHALQAKQAPRGALFAYQRDSEFGLFETNPFGTDIVYRSLRHIGDISSDLNFSRQGQGIFTWTHEAKQLNEQSRNRSATMNNIFGGLTNRDSPSTQHVSNAMGAMMCDARYSIRGYLVAMDQMKRYKNNTNDILDVYNSATGHGSKWKYSEKAKSNTNTGRKSGLALMDQFNPDMNMEKSVYHSDNDTDNKDDDMMNGLGQSAMVNESNNNNSNISNTSNNNISKQQSEEPSLENIQTAYLSYLEKEKIQEQQEQKLLQEKIMHFRQVQFQQQLLQQQRYQQMMMNQSKGPMRQQQQQQPMFMGQSQSQMQQPQMIMGQSQNQMFNLNNNNNNKKNLLSLSNTSDEPSLDKVDIIPNPKIGGRVIDPNDFRTLRDQFNQTNDCTLDDGTNQMTQGIPNQYLPPTTSFPNQVTNHGMNNSNNNNNSNSFQVTSSIQSATSMLGIESFGGNNDSGYDSTASNFSNTAHYESDWESEPKSKKKYQNQMGTIEESDGDEFNEDLNMDGTTFNRFNTTTTTTNNNNNNNSNNNFNIGQNQGFGNDNSNLPKKENMEY